MALRFNPRGANQFANQGLQLLAKLAMQEYTENRKQQRNQALLEKLQKGGGLFEDAYLGGISADGAPQIKFLDPKTKMEMEQMRRMGGLLEDNMFTQGPSSPMIDEGGAMMSLAQGGVGDVEGQPIPQSEQPKPAPRGKARFRPKGFTLGGVTYEKIPSDWERKEELERNAEKEIQKELIKGVSGEVGGRVALAKESIKNIQDIKKILFPDGTPKSFQRKIAYGSNLPGPGSRIGALSPSRLAGVPLKESQEVYRKMGAALSGRQLIQTGVAARPEETEKLVSQFSPNAFSSAEAAFNGLTELENFYGNYLEQTDPRTRYKDFDPMQNGKKKRGKSKTDQLDVDAEYNRYLQAIGAQ